MVTHLTDATFTSFIAQKGVVVVDFYADWCGPCKMIAPLIEQLATEVPSVKFAKLNVDEFPDLAGQNNVSSLPTILFYKDGVVANQVIGAVSKEQLRRSIPQ